MRRYSLGRVHSWKWAICREGAIKYLRPVFGELEGGNDIIPDSNDVHVWGASSKCKKWFFDADSSFRSF
jgi:hypothetical protein